MVIQIGIPIAVTAWHVALVEELDQVERIFDLDDVEFLLCVRVDHAGEAWFVDVA